MCNRVCLTSNLCISWRKIGSYGVNRSQGCPVPELEMKKDLKEGGVPVFEAMIRRTAGFPKSALAGVPIRDLDDVRVKAAWSDYQALGNEVMEILK